MKQLNGGATGSIPTFSHHHFMRERYDCEAVYKKTDWAKPFSNSGWLPQLSCLSISLQALVDLKRNNSTGEDCVRHNRFYGCRTSIGS